MPNFTRLRRWKNRHSGERCILLCNGPSLNDVDFERIDSNKYTYFGLNKIYLGIKKFGIQPKYIVCVNEKVLRQSAQIYKSLLITKFLSNRISEEIIPEDPFTFYINTAGLPEGATRFSDDIVSHVHEGWTVTHAALQIIHYMGFQEVNIVGMDHEFSQHIPGRENSTGTIAGADLDHFHPSYFGGGQDWDFPDLANSEVSYSAARRVFEASGKVIYDCTECGKCRIFERKEIHNHLYTKY